MSKNKIFRIVCLVLSFILLFMFITLESVESSAYRADSDAMRALESTKYVMVEENADYIVFEPQGVFYNKGIIFYPGGNMEAESYAPLMHALSEEGYLCVLVKMPLHLAVLDVNKADMVRKDYGNVADWYMAGHSLGGAMAANYAHENADRIKGLILLAAYSTKDLDEDNLEVLSIYGSEDEVLSKERYEENRANLPWDYEEIIIDGGNHACFGNYGEQRGDGVATCTGEEQQAATVDAICRFLE